MPVIRSGKSAALLFCSALSIAIVLLLAGCGAGPAGSGESAGSRGGPGQTGTASAAGQRPAGNSGGGQAASAGGGPGGSGQAPVQGNPSRLQASNGGLPVGTARMEVRTRSVLVGGRLEPKTRVQHTVPVNGIVRSVSVRPGVRVTEGSELFTVQRNDVGQTYLPAPVTARVSGVVSTVDVVANREVKLGEAGVTVVGSNGFLLEAAISDRDAFNVDIGQEVSARSPDGSLLSGRLTVRTPEPDYTTGLFTLTFEFPNTEKTYIGEFLLIDVPTETLRGIFVPRDAVVRRYGRYYVWVVGQDDRLQRREVQTGQAVGDELRINSGLSTGERYLPRPTGREREGAPVAGGR